MGAATAVEAHESTAHSQQQDCEHEDTNIGHARHLGEGRVSLLQMITRQHGIALAPRPQILVGQRT